MDILSDKTVRSYDYTSRYAPFPFYYNTWDNKYVYGLTNQLSEDAEYVLHKVVDTDTLDKLAYKYYGRPDLYWIIADFNRIQDSYTKLFGNFKTIKIPALSGIRYKR